MVPVLPRVSWSWVHSIRRLPSCCVTPILAISFQKSKREPGDLSVGEQTYKNPPFTTISPPFRPHHALRVSVFPALVKSLATIGLKACSRSQPGRSVSDHLSARGW